MINRLRQPEFKALNRPEFLKPESVNNHQFYFSAEGSGITKVEIYFRSGVMYQSEKLVAGFTASLMLEATTSKNSNIVADIIDSNGASLSFFTANYSQILTLVCMQKKLPAMLELIKELLTQPAFDENDFFVLRNNAIEKYKINLKKVDFLSNRAMNKNIFGENTFFGSITTDDDYSRITTQKLRNHFSTFIKRGYTHSIISGDVSKDSRKLLDDFFSCFQNYVAENKTPIKIDFSNSKEETINVPSAVQSSIQIAFEAVGRENSDFPKLQLTNMVLGGYFGSRLMNNLREENGYTYGIGSSISPLMGNGYLTISTEVGGEVTQPATKEIEKEIHLLCSEKIHEDELTLARNYLFGSFLSNSDGVFAMADRFSTIYDCHLTYNYYENYFNTIGEMNPTHILETANKYFTKPSIKIIAGKI